MVAAFSSGCGGGPGARPGAGGTPPRGETNESQFYMSETISSLNVKVEKRAERREKKTGYSRVRHKKLKILSKRQVSHILIAKS